MLKCRENTRNNNKRKTRRRRMLARRRTSRQMGTNIDKQVPIRLRRRPPPLRPIRRGIIILKCFQIKLLTRLYRAARRSRQR